MVSHFLGGYFLPLPIDTVSIELDWAQMMIEFLFWLNYPLHGHCTQHFCKHPVLTFANSSCTYLFIWIFIVFKSVNTVQYFSGFFPFIFLLYLLNNYTDHGADLIYISLLVIYALYHGGREMLNKLQMKTKQQIKKTFISLTSHTLQIAQHICALQNRITVQTTSEMFKKPQSDKHGWYKCINVYITSWSCDSLDFFVWILLA